MESSAYKACACPMSHSPFYSHACEEMNWKLGKKGGRGEVKVKQKNKRKKECLETKGRRARAVLSKGLFKTLSFLCPAYCRYDGIEPDWAGGKTETFNIRQKQREKRNTGHKNSGLKLTAQRLLFSTVPATEL